jgi:hypothetical protein
MNKFLHDYQSAAEECATYVFESESEQISYEEYIQSGNDPRDHIIYHAAIVLGKQSEFQIDIDEYDKNSHNNA